MTTYTTAYDGALPPVSPLARMWEEFPEEMQQVLGWLRRAIAHECRERGISIHSPDDVAVLLQDMVALEQEVMRVLSLDAQNHVLSIDEVARGSVTYVNARAADVFRPAVRHNAVAIIIAHNHPSGSLEPSREDLGFTRSIVAAGSILGVKVLDHLIVARGGFTSLAREGEVDFTMQPSLF